MSSLSAWYAQMENNGVRLDDRNSQIAIGIHYGGIVRGTSKRGDFYLCGEALDVAEALSNHCDVGRILVSCVAARAISHDHDDDDDDFVDVCVQSLLLSS